MGWGSARLAVLRGLFAAREDPYAGADLGNAKRLGYKGKGTQITEEMLRREHRLAWRAAYATKNQAADLEH